MLRFLSIISCICWFSIASYGTHIVGGDISYSCLGDDNYRVTMKIYRNCNIFGLGQFNNPAPVSIYSGDGERYTLVNTIDANLVEINDIPIIPKPCLRPPANVCVEAGIYVFDVTLPTIDESYHIIYQRCCRNGSISNIYTPGDIGGTYTIELTPAAQANCSSSPIFNAFPPIAICVNELLEFDHSATDPDGDQLVYKFCAPLKGGGLGGTNQGPPGVNRTDCEGVEPDPSCPPPFENVEFILPQYSPLRPLGGDPVVSINTNTGMITGVPNIEGQFVVGICVEEYRAGVLLSAFRRDFQFNVTDCQPLIKGDLVADEVISDSLFIYNQCNDPLVNFFNITQGSQYVDTFAWEFTILDQVEIFDKWSLTHEFPGVGQYDGALYLNPGLECGDTIYTKINIFPPLVADFSFNYDTCEVGGVQFSDASVVLDTIDFEKTWSFGNSSTSTEDNPIIYYKEPNTYNISLNIVDEYGCEADTNKLVPWYPTPAAVIIEPSSFVGCPPADIIFTNLSSPIDETYEILWDFGDGKTSDLISPSHTFEETDVYSLDIKITSPFGCTKSRTFSNWIHITDPPDADFEFSPIQLDNFNPTTTMLDASINANWWEWDFDGEAISFEQNPTYTFQDTGLQTVTLLVANESACLDTIFRTIDVEPKTTYFLPNAFTPNGDGENDFYLGKGYLDGISDFRMEIWNRWGEIVFETNDPLEGWNGTKYNRGQAAPTGIYQCLVSYRQARGASFSTQSLLTLVR